jgi:hypothetical protein
LQYRQKGGGAPPSAAWAPVQARRTSGRGRHAARLPVRETRPRKQGFRRDARAVRELRKVLGRKSNVRRPFLPRRSRRGERLQKARQTGWHSSTTVIRSSFCRTTRNAFRGARRLRRPERWAQTAPRARSRRHSQGPPRRLCRCPMTRHTMTGHAPSWQPGQSTA